MIRKHFYVNTSGKVLSQKLGTKIISCNLFFFYINIPLED